MRFYCFCHRTIYYEAEIEAETAVEAADKFGALCPPKPTDCDVEGFLEVHDNPEYAGDPMEERDILFGPEEAIELQEKETK